MDNAAEGTMQEGRRQYNLVVFGASGFTGQYVVEEIARTIDSEKGLKWAIAGRSMCKLQTVLATASKVTEKDLSEIPIVIAELDIANSLLDMCKQTDVVINCVGPYSMYGTNVVKACIEAGTHHIDICGEPAWLEMTHLSQNENAKRKGVYILEACGFDSIPAEMGLLYTKKLFDGDLNGVECFLSLHSGPDGGCGHYGTWLSAIEGYANQGKLRTIRRELYGSSPPRIQHRIPKRSSMFYENSVNSWCVPFPGADRSIVYRSEYFKWLQKKQRLVQFKPYYCVGGLLSLILLLFMGLLFTIFTKFDFGIYLLKTYPRLFSLGVFSHKGPTRKQMENTSFSLKFVGYGYKSRVEDVDKGHEDLPTGRIVTQLTGPDPGYLSCSICVVQAAYVLLSEADKLPPGGGVMTPGLAFPGTSLIDRLQTRGLHFALADN